MTEPSNNLPGPDLLRAGLDFAALRLWEVLEFDEAAAFVVPGEAHPVFGVVMGQSGQEFGITLIGGSHGPWNLHQMLNADDTDEDFFDGLSFWGITLTRASDLPAPLRKALKASSVKPPRGQKVPVAVVKEAGRVIRNPTAREEKVFLYCLNGMIKAVGRDDFLPAPLDDDGGVPTLILSGPPTDPEVAIEYRVHTLTAPDRTLPTILPPDSVRQAPRIDGCWIVGFPIVPIQIGDDDRTIRALMVIDADSGMILHMDAMPGDELEKAAASLFTLVRGAAKIPVSGLPQEMIFATGMLHDALGPALKALRVSCSLDDRHPAWIEARENLNGFVMRGPGGRR